MSALVSPFFVWLAIRHDGRWQDVSVFTLVMQVALLVVFALFSYVTETRRKASSKAVIGLFQRLYLGVYYTWLVVVAVELIRWHR